MEVKYMDVIKVVKSKLVIRQQKNGLWQLVAVTMYDNGRVDRHIIRFDLTYDIAYKLMTREEVL